jgi:PAS domain S-box-containing protein
MVIESKKNSESSKYKDCYREIFYNNHTVMMLIDPVNFNILDSNPAASNFYGYDHDELTNMKISEINISDESYVFEEMQKAVSNEKNYFIFKHRLSNGEIRDVNVCSSLINFKGKTLLHSIVNDITERQKSESDLIELKNNLEDIIEKRTIELEKSYKSLKESQEHYKTLFNSMDECFCTLEVIFDKNNKPVDYRFLEINPAFETQIGMIKAEGKLDNRPSQYSEQILFETYGEIALTGRPRRFIYEAKEFNKWYDVYAFKVNNKKREVAILFNDITKFKNVESELIEYQNTLEEKVRKRTEELVKSNSELANFAYISSHDIREPLRMISSFLQLLERRYEDQLDEDANEFIRYAVDGAKHLNDMIIDLLKYSKLTKKESVFKWVKLENVLENALINLNTYTEENNAIISYDPLPTVNGDDKLLTMLFQNIIENGIKYNGTKQPKIHISATMEDNQYVIGVKDNGIGIKPEHLERIFTIFKRLHGPYEYSGTGIGLAIAQKIINIHHGKIWVDSKLGKGTTFYFSIPD